MLEAPRISRVTYAKYEYYVAGKKCPVTKGNRALLFERR